MSFYTSLLLAAIDCQPKPAPGRLNDLFRELGLLDTANATHSFGYVLSDDAIQLFNDADAQQKNSRFFCPDSISCDDLINLHGIGESVEFPGFSIALHGNGYLWPWTESDLRQCVIQSPKFLLLRQKMNDLFPARFTLPSSSPEFQHRILDHHPGWAWLISETVL